MTAEEQAAKFDVNGPGIDNALFGLPYTPETARLIIIPAPWEATVTYKSGTVNGPEAILKASRQIDFFVPEIPNAWKMGVAMLPIPKEIKEESDRLRLLVIQHQSNVSDDTASLFASKINESCESMNIYVNKTTKQYIDDSRMVGLVGGDHSTPLGFLRTLSEKHRQFGILHFDAHADLRKAYQGLTYSHGSIMFNALKSQSISKLVQVGIRDICEEEVQFIRRSEDRVKTFFYDDIRFNLDNGKSWKAICADIIKELPEKVYISFDIDGLDPKLCPNTGTPVPGGLDFYQAQSLIKALATSGRTIIGFDLNEVAPGKDNDWDANVGSRILWQLCNWMGVSNGVLTSNR